MSKRASIFNQGKPEAPYDERDDGPADPARRATAAQLAGRKLKAAKGVRRPVGMTSGIVASPNPFGASPGSGFTTTFGADNNNTNTSSPNIFGNNNSQTTQNGTAFGATTSSFPPTQPSTQNNIFSSSSFPAFGGSNTNTTFNPQPPSSSFNFSVGNPFTASAPAPASATNGAGDGAKPSGGIFDSVGTKQSDSADTNSMPQNNMFGGFGGSSTFGQGNPFGTSSAPANTTFGGSSMAPTSTSGMNSGFGTSNSFGATSTTQSSVFGSTSAAGGGIFGASSAPQTKPFGTFGSGTQNSGTAVTSAAQNNATTSSPFPATMAPSAPFGSTETAKKPITFGAVSGTPSIGAATSTTPAKPQAPSISFGATTSASPSLNPTTTAQTGFVFPGAGSQETKDSSKAPQNGINFLGTSKSQAATSTPATTSNLFSGFQFGSVSATPTQSSTPAFTGIKFGSTSSGTAQSSTPASIGLNFGSMSSGPAQPGTTASTGFKFGGFGASAPFPSTNTPATTIDSPKNEPSEKASATTPFSKSVQGPFSGVFSNAQAKTPEVQSTVGSSGTGFQNPFGGLQNSSASTPQVPKGTSVFAMPKEQTPASFTPKSSAPKMGNTGNGQGQSLFSNQAESSKGTPMADQQSMSLFSSVKPSATPSSKAGQQTATPKANSLNTFDRQPPTEASAPLSPASAMPTLTGAVAPPATATTESSTPKVYVAQNWPAPDGTSKDLAELSKQLTLVNNSFRAKLANLSATADWSKLSRWHLDQSTVILKQIKELRKQYAAAKGVTGNESSLSVKRKPDEEGSRNMREGSPTKKQRADQVPNTPTPNSTSLFSTTPQVAPPPSLTANLFGSAISKGSPPSSEAPTKDAETSKPSGPQSTGNANQVEGPAKSLFDSTSQVPAKPSLFKSPFEMPKAHSASSTAKSGGKFDFMAQFGKASKSAEELRAERKKKAKEEDYDSDEETLEAWSARWDKEEEERIAQQKEKLKEQSTLKPPTETASVNSIFKPTSGASSPGLFGSRPASPALPNGGGNSVFDSPAGASTPTQGNIFGHLSSAPSSNNQDDDDDEEEEEDEQEQDEEEEASKKAQTNQQSAQPSFSKHKLNQTDSESDETLEEVLRHKRQDTVKKPALIDRITRADPSEADTSESEKEGNKASTSIFSSQLNGTQTPASKPKHFFDFAAAGAQTAPPKQDSFAGDQTFKPGTPIKFGTATKGQPIFQFQPSTPSPSELSTTPSKPPPSSTFSFLNAANNPSGLASGVSTRAPTPLSEAESGRDSAVENDDDEGNSKQLNLSGLTDEEKAQHDILFSTPKAVAKHQVAKSTGDKVWEPFVNGPLWIIKNRESGRAIVRMRLLSGTTKLNYNILPNPKATIAGPSKKMVTTMGIKPDGKAMPLFFCLASAEVAEEFARVYNENGP